MRPCAYCGKPKGNSWHGCKAAQAARIRIDTIIEDINKKFRPVVRPGKGS